MSRTRGRGPSGRDDGGIPVQRDTVSEPARVEALWLLNKEGKAAIVVPPLESVYGIRQDPAGIVAGAERAALTLGNGFRIPIHYPEEARPMMAAALLQGRIDLFEIDDAGGIVRETVLSLHS